MHPPVGLKPSATQTKTTCVACLRNTTPHPNCTWSLTGDVDYGRSQPPTTQLDMVLDVREVADRLKVCQDTVYGLIASGRLRERARQAARDPRPGPRAGGVPRRTQLAISKIPS